ncbi:hypothetical protein A3C05_03440 [Candidatus Giovannonibacteria bacterium RIFCSPHIGHO2_02_FULL_45_40]|uniref:Uncharacterized protein n=1 Tax=Candidatus Giovannonibacteria bacterium RIFCSPHIGHO2_02_FULL_45_40 TaxID=1798337 RepID=A0A1F5WA99_9BACT|nr:MAG: hypothetical protein A2656_01165 [Candidatus Giovannonibacteria bacterium RIFCSPHIGHO2_01_FULL_44_100]OGF72592.1 MAG: hypothetical protein A3C05_03440 [Candidatus Giovannonibacteria bacterium RIFCSPHIGHO2_02_FULL_45_40]
MHREGQDGVDNMHETFKDYHNWKMDTRDFFLKHNFEDEADFFFEGDSVPMLKGGIEYSDIDSPESKELLKNIQEEAKEKLRFLREFRGKMGNETGKQDARKNKATIKLSFPELVKWERVMLKMKDGMREIEIFYNKKHIKTADYIELGFFIGKKQQKQDRQWGFLSALSVLAGTNHIEEATPEKMRTMITSTSDQKNITAGSVHQIKSNLAKQLQMVFETNDAPFHDRRDYYEPKFTILPEPDLRREEPYPQGGRLNENRGYEDGDEEAR